MSNKNLTHKRKIQIFNTVKIIISGIVIDDIEVVLGSHA